MKTILLSFLAIGLVACQSTEPVEEMSYSEQKAWAEAIVKLCADQGIPPGHPEFEACVTAEAKRDAAIRYNNEARRQRALAALGQSMASYGQSLQNTAAQQRAASTPPRTVNCTTTTFGTALKTSCY